ncbi:MAG: hypothetical protein WCT39_02515 [Candidatus Margulisiibacteriota bacterium]
MDKKDHLALAEHFEEIANLINDNDDNGKHIIGSIIAHHYSALHYIDAYLYDVVKPPEERCPFSHKNDQEPNKSRYHIMLNNLDKDIFDRYERLHNYSQRARYKKGFKDFPPNHKQIDPFIKDDLKQIKKHVLNKLKLSK